MSKNTQMYNLYSALKDAGNQGMSKPEVASLLGIQEISVPVYIFSLKKHFNADLKTIKSGRKVIAYKLVNDVAVPQYRKNSATVKTTVKKVSNKLTVKKVEQEPSKEIVSREDDFMTVDDRELMDIKGALGLI